jgi:hypothetical protein
MGALAPGSAHARPSGQAPIVTSGIFFLHSVWDGVVGVQKNANFPTNLLAISGNFKHF